MDNSRPIAKEIPMKPCLREPYDLNNQDFPNPCDGCSDWKCYWGLCPKWGGAYKPNAFAEAEASLDYFAEASSDCEDE